MSTILRWLLFIPVYIGVSYLIYLYPYSWEAKALKKAFNNDGFLDYLLSSFHLLFAVLLLFMFIIVNYITCLIVPKNIISRIMIAIVAILSHILFILTSIEHGKGIDIFVSSVGGIIALIIAVYVPSLEED